MVINIPEINNTNYKDFIFQDINNLYKIKFALCSLNAKFVEAIKKWEIILRKEEGEWFKQEYYPAIAALLKTKKIFYFCESSC